MTYAPTSVETGTLAFVYRYTNDAGNAGTGTVNISYASVQPHLYVTNFYSGTVDECAFGGGGGLSSCTSTPSSGALPEVSGMVFNGNNIYVTNFGGGISLCAVNSDGTFNPSCTLMSGAPSNPWSLAIGSNYLYMGSGSGNGVAYCQIDAQGLLQNCAATASSGFSFPQFITLSGSYAYIGNQGAGAVAVCTIGSGGALTNCANSPVGSEPNAVVIFGNYAYVDDDDDHVYQCTVGSGGVLTNCTVSDGGATFAAPQQLALH